MSMLILVVMALKFTMAIGLGVFSAIYFTGYIKKVNAIGSSTYVNRDEAFIGLLLLIIALQLLNA